jgi:hypothetical protein
MQQDHSSTAFYCQRMKTTADALRDVGHPVKDSELVLNLLRGLNPREPHLAQIKRILRYVKGTLSLGLHIGTDPVDSLTAYSDADWGGCPDSRRSTSGYCVYLGDNLVS